jgi:hypothetical protein
MYSQEGDKIIRYLITSCFRFSQYSIVWGESQLHKNEPTNCRCFALAVDHMALFICGHKQIILFLTAPGISANDFSFSWQEDILALNLMSLYSVGYSHFSHF